MPRLVLISALASCLVGSSVSTAWAGEPGPSEGSPVVGGFGVGDGLEALVDERDGSATLSVPVGPLALGWDSRRAGAPGRYAVGSGWGFGLGYVDTDGGVRVTAPSSGVVYEMDQSQPSGLSGYTAGDVTFRATPDAVEQAYVLRELGGVTTSYNAAGDPLVQVAADGARTEWVWHESEPHRLMRVIDRHGVETELDWEREPGVLFVRQGANLSGAEQQAREWRVVLDDDRVSAIVDPDGGETRFGYDGDLLQRVESASGATTELRWQRFDDGVPRVEVVRTTGRDGAELSLRTWRRAGAALPSGWPIVDRSVGSAAASASAAAYETELGDGATAVRSEYGGDGTLRQRAVAVTGAAGEVIVQEHAFDYPKSSGDAAQGPVNGSKPVTTEVTSHDGRGGSRTARSEYAYDEYGSLVREQGPDGTVTETTYDRVDPDGDGPELPVGLPLREAVTGPDGLVSETEYTLDAARAAAVATVVRATGPDGGLEPVSRVERTVEADGFVSEERRFPNGDPAKHPVISRWQRNVDVAAGTKTITATDAADTPEAVTTAQTASLLHGGVTAEIDAVGNESHAAYDGLGRVIERADASGRTVSYAYESAAEQGRNATTETGPDGVARTEVRDELDRVVQLSDNVRDGSAVDGYERVIERRDYQAGGGVRITDAWGATTKTQQDVFGRVVQTVAPSGMIQATEYDDVAGTVTTGWTPTGDLADAEQVAVEHRDTRGRVTATDGERRDGVEVPGATASFDGLGRQTATTVGGRSSSVTYDAAGDPVTTIVVPDPAPAGPAAGEPAVAGAVAGVSEVRPIVAERRFDGFGQSVEKVLSAGEYARSGGADELDALGRVAASTDQLERESRIEYTPDGLVKATIAASGRVVEHEYDDATRQLVRTVATAPGAVPVTTEREFDPVTGRTTAVFDPADRANTEVKTSYDDLGNVLAVEYPGGRRIVHEYDEHGRAVTTTDVAGLVSSYAYDEAGQLAGVVQHREGEPDPVAEVSYERDALGRITRTSFGNGVDVVTEFTSASQHARQVTTRDGVELSVREYEYAPSGELTLRIDRVRDDSDADMVATTTAYRYDGFSRLIGSSVHDGAHKPTELSEVPATTSTVYELTPSADIETETVTTVRDGKPAATTRAFEYSPLGELTAITTDGVRAEQAYDAAGNLVRDSEGTEYAYDALGRPVSQTGDELSVAMRYWPDGSRRERAETGVEGTATATFYWNGDRLVNDEHTGAGEQGVASYLFGTGRHGRTTVADETVDVAYFGVDRHSNVTELTDASGAVLERYGYTDYGVETGRVPGQDRQGLARNPFRYAGEQSDPDGTQWLAVRAYHAAKMQFGSPDRADLHNDYNFADLNPIMKVDPTGHWGEWDSVVDAATGGLAALFVVATLASAIYTGGWSLSALGAIGLLADAATVASSTTRILSRETSLTIDPLAEQILLGIEIGGTIIGAAGAAWTLARTSAGRKLHTAYDDLATDGSRLQDEALGSETHARQFAVVKKHFGQRRFDGFVAKAEAKVDVDQVVEPWKKYVYGPTGEPPALKKGFGVPPGTTEKPGGMNASIETFGKTLENVKNTYNEAAKLNPLLRPPTQKFTKMEAMYKTAKAQHQRAVTAKENLDDTLKNDSLLQEFSVEAIEGLVGKN